MFYVFKTKKSGVSKDMRLQWHLECLEQPWLGLAAGLAAGDGTGRGGTSSGSIQTIVKHSANWSFYHFIY